MDEPVGLKARLGRAVESLDSTKFDALDQTSRSLIFSISYAHCAMLERSRRFGTLGFALPYDFSPKELLSSVEMLSFMVQDGSEGLSWDRLRYVCGNVVYGGHMIDENDVSICEAYMRYFVNEKCVDEPEMFPYLDPKPGQNAIRFKAPSPSSYSSYVRAVQRISTDDTPTAFGLHANCDFSVSEKEGRDVMDSTKSILFSEETSRSKEDEDPMHREHQAESAILDILDICKGESLKLFNIDHLARLAGLASFEDDHDEDKETMRKRRRKKKLSEGEKKRNAKLKCARNAELKYAHVFLQECVRANMLLDKMRSSLRDVELTRKGERDSNAIVESTFASICQGKVPESWTVLAYPSERSLMSWFSNMIKRVESLRSIAKNKLQLPNCTWLPGLFNPRSFLYALKCAFIAKSGKNNSSVIDVDTVCIETSVLKMQYEDIQKPARHGTYVYGLCLEGARWDMISNTLEASKPKVMFCDMPVVNMKVVLCRPKEKYAMFRCPLYQTRGRGPQTHLLDIDLRTKHPRDKWTLAGAALMLDRGDEDIV